MRALLPGFVFLFFVSLCFGLDDGSTKQREDSEEKGLVELSDEEADGLVVEEAQKLESARVERRRAMEGNRAVSRTRTTRNGKRTSFTKIKPPTKEADLPTPKSARVEAELRNAGRIDTDAEPFDDANRIVMLSISATVYDREVTALRWTSGGERRVAYSNIDFSLFRNVNEFNSDGTLYRLNLGLGEEARPVDENGREGLPSIEEFTKPGTYYVASPAAEKAAEEKALLVGLNALHRYYQQNEAHLKIADQRRRALSAARKRYREANPPEEADTVIQFWRDDSSGTDISEPTKGKN